MLFRPSFCSNCGEKIERPDWHWWTSGRFCEVCETDFKVQEYAPRILVGLAIIILGSSVGSYLFGVSDGDRRLTQINGGVEKAVKQPTKLAVVPSNPAANLPAAVEDAAKTAEIPRASAQNLVAKPPVMPKSVVSDAVYFCGAQTKKGTACSRRVKGNARCFQHTGMPALLTSNELKAGG